MLLVGFEPTISVGERPQTFALDRPNTGTGLHYYCVSKIHRMTVTPTETQTKLCMICRFCSFCVTRSFISVFKSTWTLSLSWSSLIQFTPSYYISLTHISLFSSHLRLCLLSVPFSSGFPHRTLSTFFLFVCCHMHRTAHTLFCLTLRWLMSYIYGAPILDVSRSHTTTQHSR